MAQAIPGHHGPPPLLDIISNDCFQNQHIFSMRKRAFDTMKKMFSFVLIKPLLKTELS
jgi:hypothetical protein